MDDMITVTLTRNEAKAILEAIAITAQVMDKAGPPTDQRDFQNEIEWMLASLGVKVTLTSALR